MANIEDANPLIKASASVGTNYIEANEAWIKISRKEAKESAYFLLLIYETNQQKVEYEGIELRKRPFN